MRYLPLANRVFLDEIEEDKRAGSLWIPDIARKNKGVAFGVVRAVGPGRHAVDGKLIPCHVKVGDVVCYPRQAPVALPILVEDEWKEVLMLEENSVISVVEGLPRATGLTGLDGAILSIAPQSLARPDVAYANEDAADRSIADLRQSNAPPDVIEDVAAAYRDDL